MPRRLSYRQGTPNWVELLTTDPEGARSFYGRLFHWEFEERPMYGGSACSVAVMNDGVVAALVSPAPGTATQETSATWRTYLAVDDVDATATGFEAAGGRLLTPPVDALESGRVAFGEDVTGVGVGLWQAKDHIGATVVNEPGAFIWSELMTSRTEAAAAFYEQVFGLTTTTVDLAGTPFTGFTVGGEMIGGLIPPQREGVQPRWIVYFCVADVDEAVERVGKLGGAVVHGPIDTPVGPLAALRDPQGAAFSIWAFNGETQ